MEEDEWDDALLSEIEALESRHLQSHKRQHESVAAAAGAWSCRSCTLQNEATRTTCLVCCTPRGRSYQAPAPAASPVRASTAPRKTVQATLSFDGTSTPVAVPPSQQKQHQEQSNGRSEPSPFSTNREQAAPQLTPKPGLVMTSRRSGDAPTAISTEIATAAASSPVQMRRHAAGEDAKAKTRYLDIVARSNFPQIDYEAAQSFVYPTNYSIRDYQLTIAEKALYHNTLVSLPTGLGKTLVAAVVMYNFYRWFPTGKIVFMAPTKPLVAQQIKACHEIMGIPLSDTAELQGNVPPTMRRVLWNSRRVFFCTPQSLQNDLRRGVCAAEKFVCIVVDEAHRATGNYAYCCVVQEIEAKTQFFRVLALSATPGAKFDVIQEVVTNLRISHIESRSADDADVKKYTHARQEEVIVCRLGAQILEVKTQFLKFFPPIIQRLLRANIIQNSDPEKLSSWYVLQARERFRKSPSYSTNRSAESDLALLVSLLHAKSLLTGHGLSSFREQIMSWAEDRKKGKMSWSKRELVQSKEFQALELSLAVTPGGSSTTNTASHPKLVKLREVLLEHFQRHAAGKSSTRAIVFTQFRASVSEIVALLRPLAPLLNVQPFIGQGASGKAKENKGQTQKVQQEIVRRFRLGEFNVLVATCIAEEGLDIGEVDLIVSFDALTSPVRMIQRMGRTGRKRVGRVIILVTEGDEQKKLARSASAAKTVSRALTTFKNRFTYSKSPRMLPTGICPQLRELQMKIPTFHASQVGGKAASGEVDPDLWQLTDAERAIALMKYFPPNFASSSRNRVFPVIANRAHLLRPQQRSLVRKGVSSRVGYSSRSLMLQHLVRKINGVEEVLDSESDDEDDKNGGNGNQPSDANSSNITQQAPADKDDFVKSPRLETSENRRRSSMSTSNADTDNEMGSPWRPTSTPSGLEDGSRCDDSFSVMDESVNCVDMHFSPQFVDPATQLTPAVEGVEPSTKVNKRQRESHDQISSPKRQKIDLKDRGLPGVVCSPSESKTTIANTGGNSTSAEGVAVDAPGVQLASMENFETDEKSQQMSATLSLTLTSDSPRPPARLCGEIRQQNVVAEVNNIADSAQQLPIVPRSGGTRQLQFDDDEGEEDDLDQTQSAEMPQSEHTISEPPSDKHDVPLVEDEKPHPSSFALLPPPRDTKAVAKPEGVLDDGDQAEAEPSAYSFALLPPLDESTEVAPESPDAIAPSEKASSQPVDDGTDGDELDEPHEPSSVIKSERAADDGLTTSADATVVDLTSEVATQHEVKAKPEVPIVLPPTNVDTGATHQALSNQKGSEPEHEDEGGCSICMESESYDDDPIVFCDGCNTAVHQFCYGIRTVPRDKWFCEVCKQAQKTDTGAYPRQPSCQLCPQRGGAFKRTECGQWVHVQCFLWIPEFRVEQGDDDMLVLGPLDSLDSDRKTLDCSLCHSAKGHGIIQCAHKRCMTAFHVSCAAYAHYRMDQLDPPDGEDTGSGTLFIAYCPLHRNSTAQVNIPEQQKTPPAAKSRLRKPPLPTSATKTSSPSHLLTSPSSAEAKKKFKTFRRLKRKYDASQSQMFTQPGTKGSPAATSPWQKRIRRSKRRRETSRVLAAAFIDDTAEVRGGARGDDDDEDDYGDDYNEAADDSFINDSSQLLYSQSVESPEDAGSSSTTKRKRKKSSPNMRAIYAQSLFESQNSPLLLRRGGRHLGALPSNGIIRACLNELHNGPTEVDTPSPRPRSRSRLLDIPEGAEATAPELSVPVSASATVTEAEEDDSATEAEPSPSFNLLGTAKVFSAGENKGQVQTKNENSAHSGDPDVAPPNFSLLGGDGPHLQAQGTCSPRTPTQQPDSGVLVSSKVADARDMHKKIEANRLKALKKLEERRRQAKLQQGQQPPPQELPKSNVPPPQSGRDQGSASVGHGFTSAATLVSRNTHGASEIGAPSLSLMAPTTSRGPLTPARGDQVSTVDLTSPKAIVPGSTSRSSQPPNWIVFVSPSFSSSSNFPVFASTKQAGCTVAIDDSLEVDVLLSVRMGVLVLTVPQLHELALSAPAQNVVKSRRIETMLAMLKKIVVAVVHDGGDPPEVLRLRQLPNATVIVQPRPESLCAALHHLAQQERAQGYELPSPSMCRSDFKGGVVRGLDADFASRLEFFRTIPPMSLGSALSLSFRFKNFAAAQVPVLKFNEMHWRRMLPWISEPTAEAIRRHVQQNARRSGAD